MSADGQRVGFPSEGRTRDQVLATLTEMRRHDVDWRGGRAWSYVYFADDEELEQLLQEAYLGAFHDNALSPRAFPSQEQMEQEIVAMVADLLQGTPDTCGQVTSGGSESILMAVKAARDRARAVRPDIVEPQIVLPSTAHPAFSKAAHYLGVEPVRVPIDSTFRADVNAMTRAIADNTILVVASAPSFPHGVVDPIQMMAGLVLDRGVPLHVDACLGGFALPFARDLGRAIPAFDFSLDGVTSISVDLHKYGYAAKGASVILYRSQELARHQWFVFDAWPGGVYAVPNATGTRPGGAIAAAWAAISYLGRAGYERLTARALRATDELLEGISAIPHLQIVGRPHGSVFAFGSEVLDIGAIAAGMARRGWVASLQAEPPCLHLTVTAGHASVVSDYLDDLRSTVDGVRAGRELATLSARYS